MTPIARANLRGFTLIEVLVVIVVGGLLASVAYSLMDQSAAAARRVEFRLTLGSELEPALERVQVELDRMVPLGLPGLDYAQEVFAPDHIRFFSSRRLGLEKDAAIELVEIRLESADDVENAIASGQRDKSDGQRLLVSAIRDGVAAPEAAAGYAFRASRDLSLAFACQRAEGSARPAEVVASLRARSYSREWPLEIELSATWTQPAGLEDVR